MSFDLKKEFTRVEKYAVGGFMCMLFGVISGNAVMHHDYFGKKGDISNDVAGMALTATGLCAGIMLRRKASAISDTAVNTVNNLLNKPNQPK